MPMKPDLGSVRIERRGDTWIVIVYDNGITTERRFTTESAAKIWAFAQTTRLVDAQKASPRKH